MSNDIIIFFIAYKIPLLYLSLSNSVFLLAFLRETYTCVKLLSLSQIAITHIPPSWWPFSLWTSGCVLSIIVYTKIYNFR